MGVRQTLPVVVRRVDGEGVWLFDNSARDLAGGTAEIVLIAVLPADQGTIDGK